MVYLKCKHAVYIGMAFLLVVLGGCSTPKDVTYFQDLKPGETVLKVTASEELKIRLEDKISILVNTRDPQLSQLFNLPVQSRMIGQTGGTYTYNQGVSGYTVDADGCIDFPVLGKVHVAGQNRQEIAALLKHELISHDLVKDPVVTVEFMNLSVAVLGDVGKPGRYNIDRDRFTVLDAISMAGDLNITAKRDRIFVLREVDGQQQVHGINLLSAEQLYTSPVYYLQQNDVVYVEPNNKKIRESTPVGNTFNNPSIWISLSSLVLSICVLLFN